MQAVLQCSEQQLPIQTMTLRLIRVTLKIEIDVLISKEALNNSILEFSEHEKYSVIFIFLHFQLLA